MRILLVEDNALNRQVARELLEGEGAQVAVAEDGAQGVQYLLAAQTLPDAVLMDMQMPVMDGLEATRRIRAALGPGLRIVAMTANVSHADQARCLEAGMDEHLGKPIDLEALVRMLRPAQADAPAVARALGASPGAEEPVESLLARFGGNAALYLRSLDAFQPEAAAMLADVHAALARGDHAAAAATIHGLKGVAGTIGARALAAQMAAVERTLKTAPDSADLPAALAAITPEVLWTACARLRKAIEPFLENAAAAAAPAALQAAELDELPGLLASGNLRALDIAERMAALAAPASPQAVLAEQIQRLDFEAAGATLAQLVQAD
jgi:CheY-like chemotaxis protein